MVDTDNIEIIKNTIDTMIESSLCKKVTWYRRGYLDALDDVLENISRLEKQTGMTQFTNP